MTQSCIQLLSRVYNFQKNSTKPLCIELESPDLLYDAEYLTQNEYIIQPMNGAGVLCLSITEKGRLFVENGYHTPSPAPVTNSFNFSGATLTNSLVGTAISGTSYTFNTGASFSELKELIDSKPALDQGRLNALLAVLESVEKSDEPVKKGILVGFSDLLNKYSDLVVPIGKILLDIFAGIH